MITINPDSFELIKNANIQVKPLLDEKKRPLAHITINDKYEHTFPHTSRISKHLELITPIELQQRLNNGHFFFVNNNLIDFRDNQYNGFIHSDNNIQNLVNTIGISLNNSLPHLQKDNNIHNIQLQKIWHSSEITVPHTQSGATFNSLLSFKWNPFVKHIHSSFDIIRLICSNGMTSNIPFLNTKIPLLNRWHEHLNISANQIQNKVHNILINSISNMQHSHSTLADTSLLNEHINLRLQHPDNNHTQLINLQSIINPTLHLQNYYQPHIFNNHNISAQLPSHLSLFTLFNAITELRTHFQPTTQSSDFSLDKLANSILFNKPKPFLLHKQLHHNMDLFSSPETAFLHQYS